LDYDENGTQFVLNCRRRVFTFSAENVSLKKLWMNDIRDAISGKVDNVQEKRNLDRENLLKKSHRKYVNIKNDKAYKNIELVNDITVKPSYTYVLPSQFDSSKPPSFGKFKVLSQSQKLISSSEKNKNTEKNSNDDTSKKKKKQRRKTNEDIYTNKLLIDFTGPNASLLYEHEYTNIISNSNPNISNLFKPVNPFIVDSTLPHIARRNSLGTDYNPFLSDPPPNRYAFLDFESRNPFIEENILQIHSINNINQNADNVYE